MILALQTATAAGGAALLDSGRVLAERKLIAGRQQHAAVLLSRIDEMLSETGASLDAIDAIALCIGPGSFTGLRIGLATALGLCFGTQLRIVPVPTLAALSLQAPDADSIVPMLDARKGQVYAGVYGPEASPLRADRVCDPEVLIAEIGVGPHCLLGPGADAYEARLRAALGDRGVLLDAERGELTAATVGRLGTRLAAEGAAQEPQNVQLVYLRRSEAEENRVLDRP
jgi:tRNA threonylcarbamoyladenosine biosynthesis protein TsaB